VNRRQIAAVCYGLTAFLLVLGGVIYLSRGQFMPYHAVALGRSWNELGSEFQTLWLAAMRVIGSGMLATGGALLILLAIPFRQGRRWADYAIPVIGLIFLLPGISATYMVRSNTPANPPFGMAVVEAILLLGGFALTFRSAEPVEDARGA